MIGVRVGVGDGAARAWLLPVRGYSSLEVSVGGVEVYEGPDFEVLPAAGYLGLDIIMFAAAPAAGSYVSIDSWGETSTFQTGESISVAPGAIESGVAVGVRE